jgi:hypothetical protein
MLIYKGSLYQASTKRLANPSWWATDETGAHTKPADPATPVPVGDILKNFDDMITVACTDGTWDSDPYLHGMANGMLFLRSVVSGEDPKFLDAPAKYTSKTANYEIGFRAGLRTAGELASLQYPQLIAATGNALRRVISNMSKLITEARILGGDTACISNVEGEYQHISAQDAELFFQESLELLYGLEQLWTRGRGGEADPTGQGRRGITELRTELSELFEAALNGQPDRFCLSVAPLDAFAKKAGTIIRYVEDHALGLRRPQQ